MSDTKLNSAPGTGSLILFLLLFLIPCTMTYLSGPLLGLAVMDEGTADDAGTIRIIYLLFCYAIMLLACAIRGRAIDRKWLVAFPVVAAVFDVFLAFVPFIPSVMNILVLAMGVPTSNAPQRS